MSTDTVPLPPAYEAFASRYKADPADPACVDQIATYTDGWDDSAARVAAENAALSQRIAELEAWQPIMVACSQGRTLVGPGAVWTEALYGTTWTVIRPTGGRSYSPSGLGGTPNFVCEDKDGRRDIFCGDGIAASLMRAGLSAQAGGGKS